MSDAAALIKALPHPLLLVNHAERISGTNAAAATLLGSDCTGWHYITALRQPALLDAVEATLRDREPRSARFLGKDGTRETIWNVTIASVAVAGEVQVLLSFQDQTAMEDADAMRRDFVANVSHELRTPLTSLLGFIETLRGPARNDAEARDRFLEIMEGEAGRMHRLVEDLLSLSRVEDLARQRPTEVIPLQPLINEVRAAMTPVATGAGASITVAMPDRDIRIPGDHGQLRQVLTNLIENAVKYGGGSVSLTLTEPKHEASLRSEGVQIILRDNGEGIPAHHIARLTERFYRVDSHRSREIGGTGLGLAIVKHIVNRHRGRLRIDSEIGQGSEFKVILPTSLG